MRLINVHSMSVEEFIGRNIPPYGILSHTWEGSEVSYDEMRVGTARSKEAFHKIEMTCKLASRDGLAYVWVDTCCIDKSSSAELTEGINSMFVWYKRATVCYVYLSDLESSADVSTALEDCRWFSRGWTLQELIAPQEVKFFDQNWQFKGCKNHLLEELSDITGISSTVLEHLDPLSSITVAARLSWAAYRETTREEDAAYCLLGIFDVNMPLLYGEGKKAFRRLQEEIIKAECDLSIFAWTAEPSQSGQPDRRYSSILAESPMEFSGCRGIIKANESTFHADFSITNRGIRMHTSLLILETINSEGRLCVQDLGCFKDSDGPYHLGVRLRKCGPDMFVRDNPYSLQTLPSKPWYESLYRTIYILSKLPEIPHLPHSQMLQRENDLIISCRTSAVQIRLPPGFTSYGACPVSHFDEKDGLFFTTGDARQSWCLIQFYGESLFNGRKFRVSCFFLWINWHCQSRERVSTLVDESTGSCDPVLLSQFVTGVGHEQHNEVPLVMYNLGVFGIPVQDCVVLKKGGSTLRISHSIRKVFQPDICNNEMYQVDITLESPLTAQEATAC
ncbi:heterokaryon incompatibility protein-domain-containing protein [Hyaloscypha finlandica]|nr:heterokaryon incompatibility protein-domain-containing protein [Hyaloscypha finlandica]